MRSQNSQLVKCRECNCILFEQLPVSSYFDDEILFCRVDPTVPVESSEDPRQKLSALELAAFYDCMDSNDALAVMAEFTEIPADLKEVLDMGTEGREQNEERLVKLFSLLKLNLF